MCWRTTRKQGRGARRGYGRSRNCLDIYLAICRAGSGLGPSLPKPDAKILGPRPAVGPKNQAQARPITQKARRASGRSSSLNCEYDRPGPDHRAENLGLGPTRGQGRAGLPMARTTSTFPLVPTSLCALILNSGEQTNQCTINVETMLSCEGSLYCKNLQI